MLLMSTLVKDFDLNHNHRPERPIDNGFIKLAQIFFTTTDSIGEALQKNDLFQAKVNKRLFTYITMLGQMLQNNYFIVSQLFASRD